MRFYFTSLLNILFIATYSCECFANTDFINTLFSSGKMFHLSSTSQNPVHSHTTDIFLYSLHIIFSVFSSFYFIFPSNCPASSTNKCYEVALNRRQLWFIAKVRLHGSSVPKMIRGACKHPRKDSVYVQRKNTCRFLPFLTQRCLDPMILQQVELLRSHCPELIPGLGTLTALATFLHFETVQLLI